MLRVSAFLVQSEEILTCVMWLRVRGAVFGDLCACGVLARAAFSCTSRGPVPVIRELRVHCAVS